MLAAFLVGYEGHTRLAYARDLSDWLAFCDRHNVEPLSAHRAHLDAYARELTEVHSRARSTVARRLSAIAGFYREAARAGWEPVNQHELARCRPRWSELTG
ncbi:MAG: site-specific integrase [Blastococcus sp.]